jgi:AraC family transcriptional regulator
MLSEKKFVGKRIKMSFSENKTHELWRSFMSGRREINSIIGMELYSIEVYEQLYFDNFIPKREFDKWAAVEVMNFDNRPHFAVMGEKYKNEDPDSEEELWIPIKNR